MLLLAGCAWLMEMLGLDLGGVDFGLSAPGEMLMFEANGTMVVPDPRTRVRSGPVAGPPWTAFMGQRKRCFSGGPALEASSAGRL